MLAYVFWHWRERETGRGAYERALSAFHGSLAETAPEGFRTSVVFRVQGLAWLGVEGDAYEDWYLLDSSAALDSINEAAVSPLCKESHDAVAHAAAGGAGGLFRLSSGTPAVASARYSARLAKPKTTGYAEFYAGLRPWSGREGVSLWRRQMVLGSAPEFCLLSSEPLGLAAEGALEAMLEPLLL